MFTVTCRSSSRAVANKTGKLTCRAAAAPRVGREANYSATTGVARDNNLLLGVSVQLHVRWTFCWFIIYG